jgi:nucleotide-binding universal stress UspA family protein
MVTIRGVLVPTDFSEPAGAALAYARSLAEKFGSRLYLLHVVPIPQVGWAGDRATFAWPTLLADLATNARQQLNELIPAADPLPGRTSCATTVGNPVASILQYVDDHEVDLIVMGTHGRGFIGHMLLGSVAERIVRLAPVPVLTVHGAPAAMQPQTRERATEAQAAEVVAS